MDIIDKTDIYSLIFKGIEKIASRQDTIDLREKAFKPSKGLKKCAFDTRRIDQVTQLNPRRGLQNYNRSEAFVTEALSNKMSNLNTLKIVLNELKVKYEKSTAWHDSNTRVLLSHLEKALRSNIDDDDFTENQQGVGSLDYLEELLYVRYRLVLQELNNTGPEKLKEILLSKDEDLLNDTNNSDDIVITKDDVGSMSYDQLLNTLFAGVKATQENKKVKRKITIEIEDSIDDETDPTD